MKLFPRVTKDFNEYRKLSGSSLQKPSSTAKGYYYNGVIWIKDLEEKIERFKKEMKL